MTVEDKSETSGPPGETDEEMKVRKRKERMIEELQRTVITLSKENKELNERNETLRRQLMEIGAKVCSFLFAHIEFSACLVMSCINT